MVLPPDESGVPDISRKRTTDSIIPSVYAELRNLAKKKIAQEGPGHTLNATALVHDAYVALARGGEPQWENRGHFYVAAAEAMRRLLIDRARRKKAAKHGGGHERVPLFEDAICAPEEAPLADELIALDEALAKLEKEDERKVKIVSLRYFVGLTIEEAADVIGISTATAKRDWAFTRLWLQRELNNSLTT